MADQTFEQQVITSIPRRQRLLELAFARGNVDVALHQINFDKAL